MAPRQETNSRGAANQGSNGQSQNGGNSSSSTSLSTTSTTPSNVELTQALRDLARGEQAANALEADLAKFESKLDEILASLGVDPSGLDDHAEDNGESKSAGEKNGEKKD